MNLRLSKSQKSALFEISALAFVVALAFYGLLSQDFWDGYDDWNLIQASKAATEDIGRLFSAERGLPVRPPRDLLFLGIFYLWGENPIAYRCVQIFLHLMGCILLAHTCRRLGIDPQLSFVTALLFAVNVAHFRAVHWITCISYILAFIFCLLTFISALNAERDGRVKWKLAAISCLSISIFSHPSAVFIVGYITYDQGQKNGFKIQTLRHVWHLWVTSAVMGLLALLSSPQADHVQGLLTKPDLARFIKNLLWYLGRLWTASHWIGKATIANAPQFWEMGVGALFLLFIIWLHKQRHMQAFNWAIWSFLAILPFLNNPHFRLDFGPSRQIYFASAGTCFILAWGLRKITRRLQYFNKLQKHRVYVCLVGIFVIFGVFFLRRAERLAYYWAGRGYAVASEQARERMQTASRLFRKAIEEGYGVPDDVYLRYVTATISFGRSSQDILDRAHQKKPEDPDLQILKGIDYFTYEDSIAWKHGQKLLDEGLQKVEDRQFWEDQIAALFYNLGGHYFLQNDYNRAAACSELAIRFKNDYAKAHFLLAQTQYHLNRKDLAQKSYARILNIDPQSFKNKLLDLANRYFRAGDLETSIDLYDVLLQKDSTSATLHYNLGILLKEKQDFQNAKYHLRKAINLDSTDAECHLSLSEILYKENDLTGALEVIRQVLARQPDHALANYNLGIVMFQMHRLPEALKAMQKAEALDPQNTDAKLRIAQILERMGKTEKAIKNYRQLQKIAPNIEGLKEHIQELEQSEQIQ